MSDGPRPREPVRLVVSDIDGTLVNHAKELTPRTRDVLAALQSRGIDFTVTTARPPVGLRPIIDSLKLTVPSAAINGGVLVAPDLSISEVRYLPADVARQAVGFLRSRGIDPWLFTEYDWHIRDPHGAKVDLETHTIAKDPVVVEDFTVEMYNHVLKVIGACDDHPLLARCETDLQTLLGDRANATRSQVYYLDVTSPLAHKGEAIKSLSRAMDVPIPAILAIGDGTNDIPMLKAAGFSVAMGNGSDLVKASAHVVTEDCEHDGFALAIERYVLNG